MIVKLVILLVFVLQGVVSGLRFPEEILARGIVGNMTPGGGGENSAPWLNLVFPAFVALVVLAGNTGVYFLGLFVFSRKALAETLQRNGCPAGKIIPFLDFTWIWLLCFSTAAVFGLIVWIRSVILNAPDLLLYSISYFGFTGYFAVLYCCFCTKFSDEQQRKYLLGAYVNSGIRSLFRKVQGIFRA